jgi:short-subunit dehydrogenase
LLGKGGSIILTGSSAGTTGTPALTAYSASKAAVRNLGPTIIPKRLAETVKADIIILAVRF